MTNAEIIWKRCKKEGLTDAGAAGLLGNLDCESGLNPMNLEDTGNRKLGMTDEEYVRAIDSGAYSREQFATDGFGAFLAQWTWHTRKRALYDLAKSQGVSIGNIEMQLDFLFKELSGNYASVLSILKTTSSVKEASDAVLLKFECPLDQSERTKNTRASYGEKYFARFAGNTGGVQKTMGYITCKKGQNQKLSEHFDSIEFDCHGSGCCKETKINEMLLTYLEKIRAHFGKPITITSAYRCVVHNRNVGGATGSRHSKGDATDIVVSGIAPREVAKYAESIGIQGIGLYETSADGHFVHIDTREKKSFWYGQACAYRSTFGGTATASGGIVTATPAVTTDASYASSPTLSLGSYGDAVKTLQENLIKLGYSCGRMGADGAFGAGTAQAVREFQQKAGLKVDGYAGTLTQAAIQKALGNKDATTVSTGAEHPKEYNVTVTASVLNVRKGAGVNHQWIGSVRRGEVCTIVEEATGADGNPWGKLKSGGWISLIYTNKS